MGLILKYIEKYLQALPRDELEKMIEEQFKGDELALKKLINNKRTGTA
jgi:hypothetical protein